MESLVMEEKGKPPYWEMGQRIIKVRETLTDMRQADMTAALDLKEPTYGNYERGARKMPPHIMEKFKKITGCSSDYIYIGVGPMKDVWYDQQSLEILDIIKRLPRDERDALLAYLRSRYPTISSDKDELSGADT